ncbi:general stress protein [Paenibacillus campi]|uniref:general stress protein n=1 Tax=Paenibacillus campi TaxID=3106031 RepID=UPI002B001E93|nr:general stress protein [Paenibacillus sp. SGZ-1009]
MSDPYNKVMEKIIGVFITEDQALQAVRDLRQAGFKERDISVLAQNPGDAAAIERETGVDIEAQRQAGMSETTVFGGLAGMLAGFATFAIPGVGPLLAIGPIASMFTGALFGAGAGGLLGALIGYGLSEEEANRYQDQLGQGNILILVAEATGRTEDIYDIFRRNEAVNVNNPWSEGAE